MLGRIGMCLCWAVLCATQAAAQGTPPPLTKRVYFFKGNKVWIYDPRPAADRVIDGPHFISERLNGLEPPFTEGIDAAINWGNGFIYLFKGPKYWQYDILLNTVATPKPALIASRWSDFPLAFQLGIDAAFNAGQGKAFFFKGSQYLRYRVGGEHEGVDTPDPGTRAYPRDISDPNGWRKLPSGFASGIDAAVNANNGKIYFMKGDSYVRLTFASRAVDQVSPPYPYHIADVWHGLPEDVRGGVEWGQAGGTTLAQDFQSGCESSAESLLGGTVGRIFTVDMRSASTPYPALCGCAEYRQFVRGNHELNGVRRASPLPDPNGGANRPMLPRPTTGAPDENFLEDGDPLAPTVKLYGHRKLPPDTIGRYEPDQKAGCHYRMVDRPWQDGTPGQTAGFDLDFKGAVIDVCSGNEVIAELRWNVSCSRVIPTP